MFIIVKSEESIKIAEALMGRKSLASQLIFGKSQKILMPSASGRKRGMNIFHMTRHDESKKPEAQM